MRGHSTKAEQIKAFLSKCLLVPRLKFPKLLAVSISGSIFQIKAYYTLLERITQKVNLAWGTHTQEMCLSLSQLLRKLVKELIILNAGTDIL